MSVSPRDKSTEPPAEQTVVADHWRLKTRTLQFGHVPLLMGIVNVTPDSFSDGGRFHDPGRAVDQALRLVEQGAAILDVGGESTRPYSTPVGTREELERVMPVIERLADATDVPISIDTSKAEVARAAAQAGAEIINDVTGLTGDPEMMLVARQTGCGICAMHMQGTPQTMQDDPRYDDLVGEILEYLCQRRSALIAAGIAPERICLDPGVGFGKTHQHNFQLIAAAGRFHAAGAPLLVGHSRKGFIAKAIGDKQADRDVGTAAATLLLAEQGVQVIRVHNVAVNRQALQVWQAVRDAASA